MDKAITRFIDFLGFGALLSRSDAATVIEVQSPHEGNKNETYCTHPKLDFSGAERVEPIIDSFACSRFD